MSFLGGFLLMMSSRCHGQGNLVFPTHRPNAIGEYCNVHVNCSDNLFTGSKKSSIESEVRRSK